MLSASKKSTPPTRSRTIETIRVPVLTGGVGVIPTGRRLFSSMLRQVKFS
jgi:hypothetical protein